MAMWTREIRVGTRWTHEIRVGTRKIRVGTLPIAIWTRKIRVGMFLASNYYGATVGVVGVVLRGLGASKSEILGSELLEHSIEQIPL